VSNEGRASHSSTIRTSHYVSRKIRDIRGTDLLSSLAFNIPLRSSAARCLVTVASHPDLGLSGVHILRLPYRKAMPAERASIPITDQYMHVHSEPDNSELKMIRISEGQVSEIE
jgi:hypothetical protein